MALSIGFIFNTLGQELNLTLYFEDALGNKDSLFFGFNKQATRGIDTLLGEVNLINETYDPTFYVFFSNATYYDSDNSDYCLGDTRRPTFISKHQYYNTTPIEIGIIAKNWPVTISWDKEDVMRWNLNKFFEYEDPFMFLTGWNPPGGWFDASCGCGFWPDIYTDISKASSISLNNNSFCKYNVDFTTDSICLMFAGVEPIGTNTKLLALPEIIYSYNSESKVLTIENNIKVGNFNIEITDLSGKTIIRKKESIGYSDSRDISLSDLNPGVYLVKISSDENSSIYKVNKIRIY